VLNGFECELNSDDKYVWLRKCESEMQGLDNSFLYKTCSASFIFLGNDLELQETSLPVMIRRSTSENGT
jgi:hypothetical protein